MSKPSRLLVACNRIVKDEVLIGELLEALELAQEPLDQGQSYQGEVLEVAATVREAAAKARRRIHSKRTQHKGQVDRTVETPI